MPKPRKYVHLTMIAMLTMLWLQLLLDRNAQAVFMVCAIMGFYSAYVIRPEERASKSRQMFAYEAVEKYGDELIGEEILVQVWDIDHKSDRPIKLMHETWLSEHESLHVVGR